MIWFVLTALGGIATECSVAARLMDVIASEAKQSLLFESKRLPRPFGPRNDNSSNYMRQSTSELQNITPVKTGKGKAFTAILHFNFYLLISFAF
jgi:hypothetical protein